MELRWDPLLGEWVMVSSVRRARPWLPTGFCPFCPGAPEDRLWVEGCST